MKMALQIPPINTNYPQAAPPVDPMTRISGMLNIQQQRQNLESGGIDLQAKNQANQERIATQDMIQNNPDQYKDENGDIDLDKARNNLNKIAPLTGGDTMTKLTALSKATTEAKLAMRDMTTGDRAIVATPTTVLGRLGVEDPKAYITENNNTAKMYAGNQGIQRMIAAKNALFAMMPPGPGVAKAALQAGAALMSPEQENAANSPKSMLINTGGSQVPAVATPSVAGSQPTVQVAGQAPNAPIPNTITPAESQVPITDAMGRTVLANKAPNGQMTSTQAVPGAAPGTQPNTGFQSLPPGETPDTLKVVQKARADANAAAATAPDQKFNNNQIIHYADAAITGTGKDALSKVSSVFPEIPWSGNKATDTQLLGHAMAQQQGTLAASAGLTGSDSKMKLAGEQTADGQWTPEAIKSSARVMRALGSTGAQLYNQGMENAVSTGGPFAARKFQNQWAQAANIDSMRIYDAVKNKGEDPQGLKQVVDSMGGPTSARYKVALQKINEMKALIGGGR